MPRTPQALGAELAQAVAGYLLGDAEFRRQLSTLMPTFTRARVTGVVRTKRGENRVKILRAGVKRPDVIPYPVWGSMQVPQVGDDVLLVHSGTTTMVLGAQAGGNPNHWIIPYPGATLQMYRPDGVRLFQHDQNHRATHFGPTVNGTTSAQADTLTFDPDSGDPFLLVGTDIATQDVAHLHGPEGHVLHGGDVFYGLDYVEWFDGTGAPTFPSGDSRPTDHLPGGASTYARHRISYGSPARAEHIMTTSGGSNERLLSTHDPGDVSGATNHRVYHDGGTGQEAIYHEHNRYGLVLPHGHKLVDSGTAPSTRGAPANPPKWHIHLGSLSSSSLLAGKWALVYTYWASTLQSAASPRWIGSIGSAIVGSASVATDDISVPSWVTKVSFYLSSGPNVLTDLEHVRDITPTSGVVPAQTFTNPGSGSVAPSNNAIGLVIPTRVELWNGNPHMVVSGGSDTGTYNTRVGVEPSVGTGYFKFEGNCITFPNGQTICDGAGGGGAAALEFLLDGAGGPIATGVAGRLVVPFSGTITSAELLADTTGSIVVDIWKATYSSYPPSSANTICGSSPPTISGGVKAQNSTLSGWTTSLSAGDILVFNVNSCSAITNCSVVLMA